MSDNGESSNQASAKRAALPPQSSTLSERIARLKLDKPKEVPVTPPTPLTHAVPSSSAPIRERLKKFAVDGSEAPLVPKGSFGMGAPASKIIPGGLGSGFHGAGADRNRIASTGAGSNHYIPTTGQRNVSGSTIKEGLRKVSDIRDNSPARSKPGSIRSNSHDQDDESNATKSPISLFSAAHGALTPNSSVSGRRTPMGSVSSMNVETGSVSSEQGPRDGDFTPLTMPATPTGGATTVTKNDEDAEAFKAELTRKELEAYEAEKEDKVVQPADTSKLLTPPVKAIQHPIPNISVDQEKADSDGSDYGGGYYDDILDDLASEPATPLNKPDPADGMPKVKCSDCGNEVDLMLLAEHVCAPPQSLIATSSLDRSPQRSTSNNPQPSSTPLSRQLSSSSGSQRGSGYERFGDGRRMPDVPKDSFDAEDLRTDSVGAGILRSGSRKDLDFSTQPSAVVPEDVIEDLDDLHASADSHRRESFSIEAYGDSDPEIDHRRSFIDSKSSTTRQRKTAHNASKYTSIYDDDDDPDYQGGYVTVIKRN